MLHTLKKIIEISRPIFWPSTFFVFLLGVIFSQEQITSKIFILALVWSFPYSLWVSAVNDLEDFKSDSINTYKGGISGAKLLKNERRLLQFSSAFSCIFISIVILLTTNYFVWLFSFFALLIPYMYSVYPIRLKEKPPLDSLSNGGFVTCVFLSGYFTTQSPEFNITVIQASSALFFGVSAIHIIGALRDYSPDKITKTNTIAVTFGERTSAFVAALLFALTYLALYNFPVEFKIFTLMGFGISLLLAVKPSERLSFLFGFCLIIIFFLLSSYSIIFNSRKDFF